MAPLSPVALLAASLCAAESPALERAECAARAPGGTAEAFDCRSASPESIDSGADSAGSTPGRIRRAKKGVPLSPPTALMVSPKSAPPPPETGSPASPLAALREPAPAAATNAAVGALSAGWTGALAGGLLGLSAALMWRGGHRGASVGVTAGALIGSILGGPLGGLIGGVLGWIAGTALDKPIATTLAGLGL